ncbi:hypothetical protein TEA_002570 [Camellia sinensis var. sinensis]|uniref:Protein kinase domain-containing protein n=2 Tax=Camellia sinensis TaxID=4442 RepID=A0A4S4DHZ2_CAMSN|nr:hypothetical protein TEA_002570 [Camellia sinensis var. sinensis]
MEKLLVYKYMPNGNLYYWLHPPASKLKIMKWPVGVKIAVGLARGLAWLHHYNKKLQDSKKKDVYSFGVVLLDLVTRKETINASANSNSTSFNLHDAIDNALIELGFDDEIFEFLNIAYKCVQSMLEQRPTILEVY